MLWENLILRTYRPKNASSARPTVDSWRERAGQARQGPQTRSLGRPSLRNSAKLLTRPNSDGAVFRPGWRISSRGRRSSRARTAHGIHSAAYDPPPDHQARRSIATSNFLRSSIRHFLMPKLAALELYLEPLPLRTNGLNSRPPDRWGWCSPDAYDAR